MITTFPKASTYLNSINNLSADNLDKTAQQLLNDEESYERASQALRRRFVRGAQTVEGIDRGDRLTRIQRLKDRGKYRYQILGNNGEWFEPEERIWVVAMYALWQSSK